MGRGCQDPALSPDGLTLYFVQKRPDGEDADIWSCRRRAAGEAWGAAEPMGLVNGSASERTPRPTADGRGLVFFRSEPERRHSWHVADLGPDGACVQVRELDTPAGLNGESPTPSADGGVAYFTARHPDGAGGSDIWVTRRTKKPQKK